MSAIPSLAIIAARACLGHQIARAQRVASSDWDNKSTVTRSCRLQFLEPLQAQAETAVVLKGENQHTSERAKLFELCFQSKARALKVFSGPDRLHAAVASVTAAGSEPNSAVNGCGPSILSGPMCSLPLGQFSFMYFCRLLAFLQPKCPSSRESLSLRGLFVKPNLGAFFCGTFDPVHWVLSDLLTSHLAALGFTINWGRVLKQTPNMTSSRPVPELHCVGRVAFERCLVLVLCSPGEPLNTECCS